VLVARASPEDLAALSVGTAAHAAIFIGMWGVVLAVALSNAMMARVSQRVGARDPQDAGRLGWHGMQFGCAACSPDP
jgi:Na+-driven multidrug efflux pump